MSTTFATIEAEALGLSPAERVTLADHLLASLSAAHEGIAAADELSDGAVYYANQADAEVAETFIQEFER